MPNNVVICCAEEDEPRLAPVVSALHERGCTPELLPGIDVDPMRLGLFMDSHNDGTLYVLCESERFRRRSILQAEGMFGARCGPGDKIARVVLESASADQIAVRVLGELAGSVPPDTPPPGENKDALMREVLGQNSGAGWAKKSGAHVPTRNASVHRAAATSRAHQAASGGARAADTDAARPRVRGSSGTRAQAGQKAPDSFAPKETPADLSMLDGYEGPGPADDEEFELDVDSRRADPQESQAPISILPSPAPVPEGRRWMSSLVLMVVLLAAGATAWLVTRERSESKHFQAERGSPTVATGAELRDPDSPDKKGASEAGAQDGQDTPSAHEAGEPEPPPEPRVQDNPGEETELLREAIEAGELRILDLMYVALAPRTEFNYEGAEAHCAGLSIGGLVGFRLPGPKELKSIRRSHMLERGKYWTNKPAGEGFGYIMNTDKSPSIAPARKRFGGVRANCIRGR